LVTVRQPLCRNQPKMAAKDDFMSKVVGAAAQGAVGAVVAAVLSSVSEPLVNKILVERIGLSEALSQLDSKKVFSYMKTTMATNFIKFPFFESTNVIMGNFDVPPAIRGAATGSVFCTLTLPITNYRFRKSMNLPVEMGALYQAYLPTVFRDILYGIVRNQVQPKLTARDPKWAQTDAGRFTNMFLTIIAAAVLSAPGNELRGFCLQPPGNDANGNPKAKPFGVFFQPAKFIRSTSVGALIMAFSLGVGTVMTPRAERLWAFIKDFLQRNPAGWLVIVGIAVMALRPSGKAVDDSKSK